MRVLHVYRTFFPDPPGGLQEAIRQTCRAVAPHGIRNTVFTLSPNPEPAEVHIDDIRVVRSRSWWAPASCDLGGVDAFVKFRKLVHEADVVHYYFPWPYEDLLHLACTPSRKPAVLTYISDIVRQRFFGTLYSSLMMRTLRSMDAIVANAPKYAQTSSILSLSEFASRLDVIPLGIVEAGYWPQEDDRILAQHGLEKDLYFLFVGVLRYYKGLHFLIEAAAATNLKIVVAGDGPEGPALRSLAKAKGATNVIFTGAVTDAEKLALMHNCRALVLPSHLRSEAFGMVLVEAAMLGRPMISCEIGTGTSFVNLDQATGLVVKPADPMALGQALNDLAQNAARAHALGMAARQRYDTLFSGDALGRSYAELFIHAASRVRT